MGWKVVGTLVLYIVRGRSILKFYVHIDVFATLLAASIGSPTFTVIHEDSPPPRRHPDASGSTESDTLTDTHALIITHNIVTRNRRP